MKFQKISKSTSSEIIVEQILDQVRDGNLQSGQKLPPEREMAEMFGVCRSSVREATRALTLMGYLGVFHGKGAFLKEDHPEGELTDYGMNKAISAVDSLDLVDIRNVLECKAASLAAAKAMTVHLNVVSEDIAGTIGHG
jgi:GntR family transcriptional repressor for pyruvate dehydrogenase complex